MLDLNRLDRTAVIAQLTPPMKNVKHPTPMLRAVRSGSGDDDGRFGSVICRSVTRQAFDGPDNVRCLW